MAGRGMTGRLARSDAIAAELLRELTGGSYQIGDRYPTEAELQQRFGVGRHSIREALKLLAEQGLLGRRRKTGTFVLATAPVTPYVHSLRDLRGLLDFAENTELQVQHIGGVTADRNIVGDVDDDTVDRNWLRVAGLRVVRGNKVPLCWSEIIAPKRLCPPREQLLSSPRALYEEIMAHSSLRLEYVEQEVTATLLPAAMMELLAVEGSNAALMVKRRYVAHTGETFEISYNLYPANRFKLTNIIRQRA